MYSKEEEEEEEERIFGEFSGKLNKKSKKQI